MWQVCTNICHCHTNTNHLYLLLDANNNLHQLSDVRYKNQVVLFFIIITIDDYEFLNNENNESFITAGVFKSLVVVDFFCNFALGIIIIPKDKYYVAYF